MSLTLTDIPGGFYDDPYPVYAALREAGVTPQPDGSVIVARYADLDRIYRDTATFISDKRAVFAPKFGKGTPLYRHHTTSLVFNDPPLHTRVRKIMVGAMTPRALASMEPALTALVDRLLDDLEGQGEVDIAHAFAGAIPVDVIGNLFNIPHADRAPLRGWSLAILGALEPQLSPQSEARGNAAVTEFVAFLEALVQERARNPGDPDVDVLTRLMQSDEGELTAQELYQNCIFILNAGHETTTNLIGSALWLLDRDRAARRALAAQPDLSAPVVDEVLRLESPNQFGNRLTTQDVQLHGLDIPAGTDIHLCIGAANRDPAQFEDPDTLRPGRRPNKHLAFAGGAHTCVGLSLARMEARIAIERFVRRFPDYAIVSARRAQRIRFRGFEALTTRLA